MMRQVVCRGTGKLAQDGVENFSVAGKTGTGLKAQPGGGYEDENGNRVYYASFAGFFPAEDPEITVLVSIDEPDAGDNDRFGGTAAALFRVRRSRPGDRPRGSTCPPVAGDHLALPGPPTPPVSRTLDEVVAALGRGARRGGPARRSGPRDRAPADADDGR